MGLCCSENLPFTQNTQTVTFLHHEADTVASHQDPLRANIRPVTLDLLILDSLDPSLRPPAFRPLISHD